MKNLFDYVEEGLLKRDIKSTLDNVRIDTFYKYTKDADANSFDCFWDKWGEKGNDIVPNGNGLEIVLNDREYCALKVLNLPTGKCPDFNITKITNNTRTPLFFEVHGQVTDLSGLFNPKCKFGECQLLLDSLKLLKDLSGLPREMKNVSIVASIGPGQCPDTVKKTDYKDMDEFLEPYKKFIDTVPKCDTFLLYVRFGDIYDVVKRKITINGQKVIVGNLRERIIDFCKSYYKDKFKKSCTVYTVG